MSSTNNSTTTATTASDDVDDDNHLIEQFAMLSPGDDGDDGVLGRRRSRASINFFQRETSKLAAVVEPTQKDPKGSRGIRRNSFIGLDGKIQDDYIAKRASLNKPDKTSLLQTTVPLLADLTKAESITRIDGAVLSQLLISGFARLNSKVDELNRINVYPIADGDTGANMKVCLKLPARNLILDPSSSILRVASNMAADVLLNGQGNSGTILSHFYVSLAEVIGDDYINMSIENNPDSDSDSDSLSINEFAQCLSKTGTKMKDAVSNPQEGTIISVSRDSCAQLWNTSNTNTESSSSSSSPSTNYSNLKELLVAWNTIAQSELQKTPDQLIVNGVKVLEKAGTSFM
jgi:hypothetical protein